MKKYFFFAAAALALASCSSDDFVGTGNTGNNEVDNAAINFNSGTNKVTRADQKTGADAAADLKENFVVYGYKTTSGTPTTVYDHYNVKWLGLNSQTQSESNTKGWEYVGQDINSLNGTPGSNQTIKYWDYSASQYDFVAFSFGEAQQGDDVTTQVKASHVNNTPTYTLEGTVDNLQKCFISDRVSAQPNLADEAKVPNKLVGYKDPVSFNFRSLRTKVRMAIYETVPGYSIKNVEYYVSGTETTPSGTVPTLFNDTKTIPAGNGKMTVTFGSNTKSDTNFNQALVSWQANDDNSSTISWNSGIALKGKEANEKNGTQFIGRNITDKSISDYQGVIPSKIGGLTLKVDYTLESIDGSGEEIHVKGANATIPEVYTNWLPNYAYTYIFKISDKTNGGTGTNPDDPKGLYPITFDAVVTVTETGMQETITTVEDNSITTYAKGAVGEEYKEGDNIYVSVGNNQTLYVADAEGGVTKNIALYTVTASGYSATEANVALALKNGTHTDDTWTLTEDSKSLAVKTSTITLANEIAASDAVDGNEISGHFAKFTAVANTTYAVEYTAADGTKYYKVIIVK